METTKRDKRGREGWIDRQIDIDRYRQIDRGRENERIIYMRKKEREGNRQRQIIINIKIKSKITRGEKVRY